MKKSRLLVVAFCCCTLLSCFSCSEQKKTDAGSGVALSEDSDAKAQLQGVWMDAKTEEVLMKVVGDTIFYADGTSMPAYFRIVGDSLELGLTTYHITKQTDHIFWFRNHAGDEVQLVKLDSGDSDDSDNQLSFPTDEPKVMATTEVVNIDSVVYYGGERYHWYVTVNPTRYQVRRTSFTPDGVAVEKVYYDNIIHVSIFKGNHRLFTRDFNKQAYQANVPAEFLTQSVLGNIRFSHVDAKGFHFYATVCIPDGEQCYMIETLVTFSGEQTAKLMEY